jgi:propanediol dehydratase large subunit
MINLCIFEYEDEVMRCDSFRAAHPKCDASVLRTLTVKLRTPIPILEVVGSLNNVCEPMDAVPAIVDKTIVGIVI